MTTTALATTTSPAIVHHAAISASHCLAMARSDVHDAIAAADDDHRRRQYALSARDNAAEVLTDPNSTAAERSYAGYYFADAEALIAAAGGDPDA